MILNELKDGSIYIWTVNGKIMLRETDSSKAFSFTHAKDFDAFLQQIF
jgi:hypothetical protein